jgi:endonuclease/exonuclease/phosphatase family metal-dependent hydrolase
VATPEIVVATFNLHAGIDGWGRTFDVVAACAELDADVVVLEENWADERGESLARRIATVLGYSAHEAFLCDAMIFEPPSVTSRRWGPARKDQSAARPLWVTDKETLAKVRRRRGGAARLGSWGIAVLSRPAVRRVETVELGRLSRDNSRLRAALFAEIDLGSTSLTVIGTHLAHFVQGSPVLMARLRRALPPIDEPAVIAGDMNFWGPPVSLGLPGWRRAVRARTYPAWRPHSQVDHIFVTKALQVVSGRSVLAGRSDHLPIRARLALGQDVTDQRPVRSDLGS